MGLTWTFNVDNRYACSALPDECLQEEILAELERHFPALDITWMESLLNLAEQD